MKFVSTIALGIALAVGGAAIADSPAHAQKSKKEKAEKAPKAKEWNLSKGFREAIAPAEAALKANDYATAAAAIDAGAAIAQPGDEQYFVSQYRLQLATATKDRVMQAKAIHEALASGGLPAEDVNKFNFYAGQLAYNDGQFTDAVRYLSAVDQAKFNSEAAGLGQQPENVYLLLAEAHFKQNQVPQGLNYIQQAVDLKQSQGAKAPEDWYARAASFAYKGNLAAETSKWTQAQVAAYPNPENWRSALYIFRDSVEKGKGAMDSQVNLDLLRLMHASKALASERDWFEYAALAQERGLPGEAKLVIEEGRAANMLPKTNLSVNEIYTAASGRIAADKASLPASEASAAKAANGRIAAGTADAYFSYGDYAKAASLYRLALEKGQVDADQINTRLGIALARAGQGAAAKEAFAKVTTAPRSGLAQFWSLWVDQQGTPAATASVGG